MCNITCSTAAFAQPRLPERKLQNLYLCTGTILAGSFAATNLLPGFVLSIFIIKLMPTDYLQRCRIHKPHPDPRKKPPPGKSARMSRYSQPQLMPESCLQNTGLSTHQLKRFEIHAVCQQAERRRAKPGARGTRILLKTKTKLTLPSAAMSAQRHPSLRPFSSTGRYTDEHTIAIKAMLNTGKKSAPLAVVLMGVSNGVIFS